MEYVHTCSNRLFYSLAYGVTPTKKSRSSMVDSPAMAIDSSSSKVSKKSSGVAQIAKRRRLRIWNSDSSTATDEYFCKYDKPKHRSTTCLKCKTCNNGVAIFLPNQPTGFSCWFCHGVKFEERSDDPCAEVSDDVMSA